MTNGFLCCTALYLRYIEERSFRRFVEACLEETVVVYVDRLLTQVLFLTNNCLKRLALDIL